MYHKKVTSRKSGELWTIKCSCGRSWHSERWHCEEQLADHLTLNDIPKLDTQPPDYNEFPNGEFKDQYHANQSNLEFVG